MVYEVKDKRYKFAGMLSYYPFYQSIDKKRIRLSQQFILPIYQKKGLGLFMLQLFNEKAFKDEKCFQISVESPSEQFQIVRDVIDILHLKKLSLFDHLSKPTIKTPQEFHILASSLTKSKLEEISKESKLRPLQVFRAFQISLMLCIDMSNSIMETAFKSNMIRKIAKQKESELLQSSNPRPKHIEFDGQIQPYNLEEFQAPNNNSITFYIT